MSVFDPAHARDTAAIASLAGAVLLPLAVMHLVERIVLRRAAAAPEPAHALDDPVASLWAGYLVLLRVVTSTAMLGLVLALGQAWRAPLVLRLLAEWPAYATAVLVWAVLFPAIGLLVSRLTARQHHVARVLGVADRPRDLVRHEQRGTWVMLGSMSLCLLLALAALRLGQAGVAGLLAMSGAVAMAFSGLGLRRAMGFVPHAVDQGPLREAVMELGERAKVALRQLYVVPMKRAQLANAFAVQGTAVVLTDLLIERLTRREIRAVLGHELAHHSNWHLPVLSLWSWLWLVPGVIAAAVIAGPLGQLVGGALCMVLALVGLAVSRSFEYDADRRGAEISGDADALASGLVQLARVSRMPVRWSRWFGWFVTHPSTEARVQALVRRGLLPSTRAVAILLGARPDDAHFEVPAALTDTARVFTTPFRHRTTQGNAWLLLLTGAVLAALGAALAPTGWGVLVGLVLASVGTVVLSARLALAPFAHVRRALAARYASVPHTHFVGLAPDAAVRVYEGFANWDCGFVELAPGRLVYHGDQTTFELAPHEVTAVTRSTASPGWVPVRMLQLDWVLADGRAGTFRLNALEPATLFGVPAANARLAEALSAWRTAGSAVGERAAETPAPPLPGSITGLSPSRVATLPGLIAITVLTAVVTGPVGWAAASLGARVGFVEIWASLWLTQVLMLVPHLLWREAKSANHV